MNEVNWGIIGCGDVTEVKSGPAFNKVGNSKLIAVMRRDAKKAEDYAKRHGVPKWYDNADELINDPDINAIYVATPPSSHAEYTIKAAKAKKPVYVEKPMAASYEECLEMIKACESEKVKLYVAYYRRRLPVFLKVKELLDSNVIGNVDLINIRLHLKPRKEDLDRNNLPWRVIESIAGAGYFYDLASHQFDILDYFFGPVIHAGGLKTNQAGLYNAEDTVTASFTFKDDLLGIGSWCFVESENEVDEIEFVGEQGSIIFSTFEKNPIRVIRGEGKEKLYNEPWPDHVHQPLIQTVVNDLLGTGESPSTGSSGARTNWVMDKILGKI
jgi:predicted dehydrogenase